jgi:hypothetical protein
MSDVKYLKPITIDHERILDKHGNTVLQENKEYTLDEFYEFLEDV